MGGLSSRRGLLGRRCSECLNARVDHMEACANCSYQISSVQDRCPKCGMSYGTKGELKALSDLDGLGIFAHGAPDNRKPYSPVYVSAPRMLLAELFYTILGMAVGGAVGIAAFMGVYGFPALINPNLMFIWGWIGWLPAFIVSIPLMMKAGRWVHKIGMSRYKLKESPV